MSVNTEIIEMIPLLVQGKLSDADKARIEAEIAKSSDLQKELQFWQGVYSIRRTMPHFDFSNHPSPDSLDRFAQEKINRLAPEYSEISGHLTRCNSCREDVELLRQAVIAVPEEKLAAASEKKSWLAVVFPSSVISKVVAPIAIVLIAVFSAVLVFNPTSQNMDSTRIILTMQFEKRSIADEGQIPEMQVALSKNTRELVLAFPTDRVETIDYGYEMNLNRRGGESIALDEQSLSCEQTQLLNQCELKVTDETVLNTLKEGGSFSLKVKEEFPENTDLVPAEYEFFFNVSVRE